MTYDYYWNTVLGRDSGRWPRPDALRSTVRICLPANSQTACPYENAYWDDVTLQMYYGTGLRHRPTTWWATSSPTASRSSRPGLFYYAQSGAINESLSDVFGELIDLWSTVSDADAPGDRWLMGEDLPIGALREHVRTPPAFTATPIAMTEPVLLRLSRRASTRVACTSTAASTTRPAYLRSNGTADEPGGAFNGQIITGLGITKTAKIYYEASTTLLGPGSDYRDLASILPQACANLVGVAARASSPATAHR